MVYDKNYYPTPREVIEKMVAPYKADLFKMNVLEPSAGMGAIADAIRYGGGKASRIYCCEINPEMKATLTGKGYKVVQEDFLQYSGSMNFDLIIMNPPFDRGVDHLLKAWEIMRNGHIVCLLNFSTIENDYSESRRRLAEIIEKHGSVENLGPVFSGAARTTGVDVALVRLEKKTEGSAATFENLLKSKQVEEIDLSSSTSSVEKTDYVNALCRSYQKAVESTQALFTAMQEFKLFVDTFTGPYDAQKMCNQFFETSQKDGYSEAHNEFVLGLQRRAWNTIFTKTRVSGLMTKKVREKFDKWREEMGGADLNVPNINFLFEALIQQRKVISLECITEVFDDITWYADKNRNEFGEKWKTNSRFFVPETFILPRMTELDFSGYLSLYYGGGEKLDDIDRALCLVCGKSFEDIITTREAMNKFFSDFRGSIKPAEKEVLREAKKLFFDGPGNVLPESEFFTFKAHKKGTTHFKFKDNDLRMRFNRVAAEAKGWQLPEEEKFHGKARRK